MGAASHTPSHSAALMATISKRVRGRKVRWLAQVRRAGYPATSRTFDTRAEAERWAREIERQQDEGVAVADGRRYTLGALLDAYLGSQAFRELVPRGQTNRRREIDLWRELLGDSLRLSALGAGGIEAAMAELARRPTVHSTATVRNYLAALGAALEHGRCTLRWLAVNPLSTVKRPRPPRSRVRVVLDDELPRLEAACRRCGDDRLWPLVAVALSSGVRQAGLVGLRWEHVNLERGALLVRDKGRGGGLDRRAWISGRGAEALAEYRQTRGGDSARGPVWTSQVARGAGRVYFPEWAWQRALEEAGIEGLVFHGLRHTAATWMAVLGASELEVQLFLGHSNPQMLRAYVHLGAVLRSECAAEFVRRPLW